MKYQNTTALKKILGLKKRLKIIQGGTAAGKTIGILLIFIDRAQSTKNNLASVVSETFPHLKRGAVRDFLSIMETHGYYDDRRWNKSELTYTFETGSKIEFFSADQSSKVRGPRRNDLFLNECNNIPFETYTQLAIRTDGDIYLDYNPVSSFWVHEDLMPKHDHDFLILTYKDNEGLSPAIVEEIESRKDNKYFWQVYGLGQIGEAEGKIYTGWQFLDEVPHEARLERYGINFGYTGHPAAISAIYYYNGGYIGDELAYGRGLQNRMLADIIKGQPEKALAVADSAEPKSIDELHEYGIQIIAADKGKDSVKYGIGVVQSQKMSLTKRSTNFIKEYRNYMWKRDQNGQILYGVPDEPFHYGMDSIRYPIVSIVPIKRKPEIDPFSIHLWQRKKPANPAR